jgi:methylmalonyl-CoA carboxyltransferase large subunit
MTTETVELAHLADALEGLRKEVARLSERVAALEAADGAANRAAPAPAPQTAPVAEGVSEEIVLVISAAIAAFLGKKAHIRQIRLVDSPAWAQQGRAIIQASHRLSHAP